MSSSPTHASQMATIYTGLPSETTITTEVMEPVCTEDDERRALTAEDAVAVDAVRHVQKEIVPHLALPLQAVAGPKALGGKKLYRRFANVRGH